jgi:hypothetical protein
MDGTELAQDRAQLQAFLNIMMNFQVPKRYYILWAPELLSTSTGRPVPWNKVVTVIKIPLLYNSATWKYYNLNNLSSFLSVLHFFHS